jgi:adenylylsulfate reductase subunit B
MSIKIEHELCVGCGQCREVCPGNLLYAAAAGKTAIRNPKDCWGCTSCLKECNYKAIQYYLGADMGGRGSRLSIRRVGDVLNWTVVRPDGRETVISVDKKQANAY